MRNNKLRIMCVALGSVGLLTPIGVNAQTTPAPVKAEKIEVTGSNIKRVDAESASPITVITQEDIRRSGSTSVQELLNNLSVSAGSALTDISGGNGFSTGSATVALRFRSDAHPD
jgi:iron complex outermembrane receptor protein